MDWVTGGGGLGAKMDHFDDRAETEREAGDDPALR